MASAKLDPQVVALTGALPDTGEHRRATEVAGDAVDHLLDEHRLAHAGTAEQGDLAATHVRGQQVDDLQAGLEHLGAGLELVEGRRLAVDRPLLEVLAVAGIVEAVAERVEDVALDAVADRHRDRGAGVGHLDAADQTVGRLHGDAAHQVVAEVLGDLERQRLGQRLVGDLGVQRVEQLRHRAARELDVDDGAGDAHDAAGGIGAGSSSQRWQSCSSSLPELLLVGYFASASAFAPPTISLISWVIWACRSRLAIRVRALMRSSALSVADFIARRRDADSDAAASSSAAKMRVATYRGSSDSNSVVGIRLEREQRVRPGVLLDVLHHHRRDPARFGGLRQHRLELGEHDVQFVDTEDVVGAGVVALVVGAGQERVDQGRRRSPARSRRSGCSEKPVHDSVIFQLRKL